jgi:3-isopropylmalate dehydratase small subunit
VIARSFAFIYARNQPTLGLLGIIITDEAFYDIARDETGIEIDVYKRMVTVQGKKFGFRLDDMELQLIENNGMGEAYKRFGSNIFRVLCEKPPTNINAVGPRNDEAHETLKVYDW